MGIREKGAYQRKIPVNANSHVQNMVIASPSLILKMPWSSLVFCTVLLQIPLLTWKQLVLHNHLINQQIQHNHFCARCLSARSISWIIQDWCYALNAKELPSSCFEAYTTNFLISFLISLEGFVPKDFLAVKESLMPNLHICALFWLTCDFGHRTSLFLSLHEYIQNLGYLLHVKIYFYL